MRTPLSMRTFGLEAQLLRNFFDHLNLGILSAGHADDSAALFVPILQAYLLEEHVLGGYRDVDRGDRVTQFAAKPVYGDIVSLRE